MILKGEYNRKFTLKHLAFLHIEEELFKNVPNEKFERSDLKIKLAMKKRKLKLLYKFESVHGDILQSKSK